MSVHAISWVLRNSEATGSQRLVLIVLADHASGDGNDAFPSVATIAREARISERAAQYALRSLEGAGQIACGDMGPAGTRRYEVLMGAEGGGAESAPPGAKSAPPKSGGAKSAPPKTPENKEKLVLGGAKSAPELTTTTELQLRTTTTSDLNDEIGRLCHLFSELTRARTETPPSSPRYRVTAGWRTEMDRLLRIDGRDPAEVEAVIRWVDRDGFWAANVLSVGKLRAKFDQLRATMRRKRPVDRLGVDEMSRWAADLDAAEEDAA